jgi:hypothetical protein
VDVFLVMEDTFDASQLTGDACLLFDYSAAQAHFGASVFWVRHRAAWPDEQAAADSGECGVAAAGEGSPRSLWRHHDYE